jgi:DNA-directed RNA polymerase specialized sigma24 family protein
MSYEHEPLKEGAEARPFQELLREAQQGSKEAAQELYDTYVKYVLRCVRQRMYYKLRPRFDSQDFVQQVFASFFVGDAKLPDFESPEEMLAYLQTLAQRKVTIEGRRLRRAKHNAALERSIDANSDPQAHHPPTRLPTPSAVAVFREQYDGLVGEQAAETREVAQLRLEGNTFPEIAEQLEMHEANARKVMRRLRRRVSQPPDKRKAE